MIVEILSITVARQSAQTNGLPVAGLAGAGARLTGTGNEARINLLMAALSMAKDRYKSDTCKSYFVTGIFFAACPDSLLRPSQYRVPAQRFLGGLASASR